MKTITKILTINMLLMTLALSAYAGEVLLLTDSLSAIADSLPLLSENQSQMTANEYRQQVHEDLIREIRNNKSTLKRDPGLFPQNPKSDFYFNTNPLTELEPDVSTVDIVTGA